MLEQNTNTGLLGNPLFASVRYNNPLVSFYNMLKNDIKVDANLMDENGNTLLHHVLKLSFVMHTHDSKYRNDSKQYKIEDVSLSQMLSEIYTVLISQGADILKKDADGESSFQIALDTSNHVFLNVLDELKPLGYNAFEVNQMQEKVEVPNRNYPAPSTYKNIPLVHKIVDHQDYITISHLHKLGVNFDVKDFDGVSIFGVANSAKMFEKLIDLGCDITYVNGGKTVLRYAMDLDNPSDRDGAIKLVNDKMKVLIKAGGKSVVDNAIFDAAKSGTKGNFVKLVKSFGLDINKTNIDGKTPLMIALENRSASIAAHLIREGADLHALDKKSVPAYMYYFKNSNFKNGMNVDKILNEVFLENIKDVIVDKNGDTVLNHVLHYELDDKVDKVGYFYKPNGALKIKLILDNMDKFGDVFAKNNKDENFLDIMYKYDIEKLPTIKGYGLERLFLLENHEQITSDISKLLLNKGMKVEHEKLINNIIVLASVSFFQIGNNLSSSEKNKYLKLVSKLLGDHIHHYSDLNITPPNDIKKMNQLTNAIIGDNKVYADFSDLHARLESVSIRNGYKVENTEESKPSKSNFRI